MIKKIIYVIVIILLTYWFYESKNFGTISGWIALFLFWMLLLWQGFKALTGGWFEKILNKLTNKTWKSLSLWAVWAAVMQSSSLVTVIAISFLTADLIPLAQWIAISLGSNVWTTTWAWIMAQIWGKWTSISAYAMPIIVFWLLFFIQKTKNLKWIWSILIWIWIVFIWVWEIQDWFETLSKTFNLKDYSVDWFKWILVFTFIWILLTILLQSSHASILLIMSALWASQLTFDNAIALAIWANIWTTFTGILGSINSNINWKRLALADLISKTLTWIIFIIFIYQVIPIIDFFANILNLQDDAFKLAIFHSFYNIIWVCLILPFYGKFIEIIKKILPEKEIKQENGIIRNNFLDPATLELPNTAIISLLKETSHMFNNSISIILEAFWLNKDEMLKYWENSISKEEVKKSIEIYSGDIDKLYWQKIKILFWEIMDFSSQAQAKSDFKYSEFSAIRKANIDIVENVKNIKHIQRNLDRFLKFSNETIKEQYEKIVFDVIKVIYDIEKIWENKEKNTKKDELFLQLENFIEENDIINNWKIDELIRNKLITNEMATSLIKDTNYKNDILKNIINVAKIIYDESFFDKNETERKYKLEDKNFDLENFSKKDLEKKMHKFKKKKHKLKEKMKKIKEKEKKENLKKQILELEFVIEKFSEKIKTLQ